MATRPYRLQRRAEAMEETRRRIVEATVDLHTTVGPAATSVAAIADRAGVQRHTVYRHFPDQDALFAACTAHWDAQHPFPAPGRGLADTLDAVYRWYERVADDVALFRRDGFAVGDADDERLRDVHGALARGRSRRTRAAIGHALEFETWRSLTRGQGLSRRAAVELMVRLVGSV